MCCAVLSEATTTTTLALSPFLTDYYYPALSWIARVHSLDSYLASAYTYTYQPIGILSASLIAFQMTPSWFSSSLSLSLSLSVCVSRSRLDAAISFSSFVFCLLFSCLFFLSVVLCLLTLALSIVIVFCLCLCLLSLTFALDFCRWLLSFSLLRACVDWKYKEAIHRSGYWCPPPPPTPPSFVVEYIVLSS